MKISTYILMAANVAVWGYFVWSGLDGAILQEARHTPGYPNREQIEYYVAIPVFMVAVSLTLPILLRRTRWSRVGTGSLIATLLLLLPFVFFYTGGM